MIHISNWDAIQEKQPGDFNSPEPGGYFAVITSVEDKEDKEYLEIWWDFLDGPYQGANEETFRRAGFWPTVLRRSYKECQRRCDFVIFRRIGNVKKWRLSVNSL